jgi:hypothetical protein
MREPLIDDAWEKSRKFKQEFQVQTKFQFSNLLAKEQNKE